MTNKHILAAIGLVLVGGLIGWAVASRSYGGGPIAGLQGQYSSADEGGGGCGWMWEQSVISYNAAQQYRQTNPSRYQEFMDESWRWNRLYIGCQYPAFD